MRASKSQVLKMEESSPFPHKSLSTSLLPNDTSWPASLSDDEIQSGEASTPEGSNNQLSIDMLGAKPPKNEELQSLPPRPPRRVPTPSRVQHSRGSSYQDVHAVDEKPNIEMKKSIDAGYENAYCQKTPSTLNTSVIVKKTDPSSSSPYSNSAHAEVNMALTTQPQSNLGGNLLSSQMHAIAESSDLNSATFSPSHGPFVHLSAPSSTLCHLQQCVTSCHYDLPPHATKPCERKSSGQKITRTVAISSPQLGPQETEMRCVDPPSPRKSTSGQNKSLKPFRQQNLSSCSPKRSCSSKGDPKSDHRNIKRWSAPSYALPWSLSSFASPKFAGHFPGSQNTFQKNMITQVIGSPLQSQKYSQRMNSSSKRSPNAKPATAKSPKQLPKSGPFRFHMSTRTSPQYGKGSEHFDNISPKVIDYESWTLGGTVTKFPSSSHSMEPQASAGVNVRQGTEASRKQTDGSQLDSIFESVLKKESNSRSEGRGSDTLNESLYSDLNWTTASQGSFEYVSTCSRSTNSRTSSDITRRFSDNSMASANGLTEITCIQDEMIAGHDSQTNILAVVPEEKAEATQGALCLVEERLKPKKSRKRPTAWSFEDRLANNGCPVGVCSPIIRMDDTEFVVAEDFSDRNSLSPSTTSSLVHDGQNYEVFVERNKIMVVIKTPPGQSLLTSGLSPLDPVIQDFALRVSPPIGSGPNNMASLSPALEYTRCADVQLQTTVIQHERLVSGARPHLSREVRGPNTQSTALTASKNWSVPGHSAGMANGRQVKSGNVSRSPPKCLKPFQRNSEGINRNVTLGSRFSRPSCGKEARGGEAKPPPKSRWQPTTRALVGERKPFALRAREKREIPNQNQEVRPKLSSVVAVGVTKTSNEGYSPSKNSSKNKFKRKKSKEPLSRPRVKQQEKPKVRSEKLVQKAKNDNQKEGVVKVRNVANKKRPLLTETKFTAPSSGNSVVGNTELNVGLKAKRYKRRKKRPIEKKKKDACDKTDIGGNRKSLSCKAGSPIDSLGSGDRESWKSARSHYESEEKLMDFAALQNVDRPQLQQGRSRGQKKMIPNSSSLAAGAVDSVTPLIESSTRSRLHNSQRWLSSTVCAENEEEISQAPPLRSQKLNKDNTVGIIEDGIRAGGYGSKSLQKDAKSCLLKQQHRPPPSPRRDCERKSSLAPNQINSWKHNKPCHTSLCSLDLLERCMMTLQLDQKAGSKPSPRSSADRRTAHDGTLTTSVKSTNIAKNPQASRFNPPSFKAKVSRDGGNQGHGRALREKPLTLSRQTTLESIQSNNTLSADSHSIASCMRNSLGSKQPSLHKVRFQPSAKEETQHSFQSKQLRSSIAQKSGKTSTKCNTTKIPTFATHFKSLLLPNSPTACKVVERMIPERIRAAVAQYSEFGGGDQSLQREVKAAQKCHCYEPDASPEVRVRDMTRHLVTRSKLGFQKSKIKWPSALIFSYPSIWLAVIVNFILMYIYNIGLGHNKFV